MLAHLIKDKISYKKKKKKKKKISHPANNFNNILKILCFA